MNSTTGIGYAILERRVLYRLVCQQPRTWLWIQHRKVGPHGGQVHENANRNSLLEDYSTAKAYDTWTDNRYAIRAHGLQEHPPGYGKGHPSTNSEAGPPTSGPRNRPWELRNRDTRWNPPHGPTLGTQGPSIQGGTHSRKDIAGARYLGTGHLTYSPGQIPGTPTATWTSTWKAFNLHGPRCWTPGARYESIHLDTRTNMRYVRTLDGSYLGNLGGTWTASWSTDLGTREVCFILQDTRWTTWRTQRPRYLRTRPRTESTTLGTEIPKYESRNEVTPATPYV